MEGRSVLMLIPEIWVQISYWKSERFLFTGLHDRVGSSSSFFTFVLARDLD